MSTVCWKNKVFTIAFLLSLSVSLVAQVSRDTTYTVKSTLIKQKKYYPDVSIPIVALSEEIEVIIDSTYRQLGDRQLLADLYIPKAVSEKLVGILMVHGGGWRSGDKSLMKHMAIKFAESGYVVMVPEYRMSLEIGYPAAVYDLKAALRWFRVNAKQLGLDEDKIAILGCSAGGQLAALVGVTGGANVYYEDPEDSISNRVQAIVDIDGVLKFKHPDSTEGEVAAQWLGGDYNEIAENWEEASALNFVDEQTPPTLFLASKYPRFLAGHREYMDILDQYGVMNKKVEMIDAPHSFWLLNPWFEPTVKEVLVFLDEVLEK